MAGIDIGLLYLLPVKDCDQSPVSFVLTGFLGGGVSFFMSYDNNQK